MTCNCTTTVWEFFASAWKLLWWTDSLWCSWRLATLNTALKHLYKDMDWMSYLYWVVPFTVDESSIITIDTALDPNLPYLWEDAPIYTVKWFYTKKNCNVNTPSYSCVEEVDDNCFSCCDNTKTYKINMFDVMQSTLLSSWQYYVPCPFWTKIYANIPCNITDWFVLYQRWFNPITSLSDCLPVPEILIPALQMILMFYALPSSGQWFKWDNITYYQSYTDYMKSVADNIANTPISISFNSK